MKRNFDLLFWIDIENQKFLISRAFLLYSVCSHSLRVGGLFLHHSFLWVTSCVGSLSFSEERSRWVRVKYEAWAPKASSELSCVTLTIKDLYQQVFYFGRFISLLCCFFFRRQENYIRIPRIAKVFLKATKNPSLRRGFRRIIPEGSDYLIALADAPSTPT